VSVVHIERDGEGEYIYIEREKMRERGIGRETDRETDRETERQIDEENTDTGERKERN